MSARWHGTAGGYTNHKCRCPACREAWSVYHRDYRGKQPAVIAQRFYVSELEGYGDSRNLWESTMKPGLSCHVLDRAWNHKCIASYRTEDLPRMQRASARLTVREQAQEHADELNAKHYKAMGELAKGDADLWPCPRCQNYVHSSQSRCPYCSAKTGVRAA